MKRQPYRYETLLLAMTGPIYAPNDSEHRLVRYWIQRPGDKKADQIHLIG
ncbi:MAG: hypothetical protein U0236_03020 [Nitrospira sp.]